MECCDLKDRVQPDSIEDTSEKLKDIDECIDQVRNKLEELSQDALQKAHDAQRFIAVTIENESDLCHHQVAKQFEPLVDICIKTLYLTNKYHEFSSLNADINEKMIMILEKINEANMQSPGIANDILKEMRIIPKKKGWF